MRIYGSNRSRLRTVESRCRMQRSVASLGLRMWRRCAFASVLSYKKVTRGSEFLPGYAMQAPGLVDLKRRRRLASRDLDREAVENYYHELCQDIMRGRQRIGGEVGINFNTPTLNKRL